MRKKCIALLLAAAAVFVLAACSSGKAEPPDLTGDWIQPSDGAFYHIATVTDDKIEIWWYLPEDDLRALYWSGSFTPPETGKEPYQWESANAFTEAELDASNAYVRASREEVKTFTYKKGQLSYNVTAGHLRMTYTLERAEEAANNS